MNNIFEKLQLGNKNSLLIIVAVAAVVITGVLIYSPGGSPDAIAKKAADYLNSNILQNGQTATVTESSMEDGLVKIKMTIGGNPYTMYATPNGKFLFPEAFTITGATNTTANNNGSTGTAKTAADLKKTDKPMLEAYVVSRCPFGIQIQRAMSKAIAAVPALADSMMVRYIGEVSGNTITAMHGKEEADENLLQICLRDEQKDKYWAYVSCYMKAGDTASCKQSTGVDSAKLNACIKDPKRGVAYAKVDFDLNKKFNITGSPTLMLNGELVSEFDFGGRSPEALKTLICGGSTTQGSFCSEKLDTQEAATSFSLTYASTNAATASAGANCDPVVQ